LKTTVVAKILRGHEGAIYAVAIQRITTGLWPAAWTP